MLLAFGLLTIALAAEPQEGKSPQGQTRNQGPAIGATAAPPQGKRDEVVVPPRNLSYSADPVTYGVDVPITPNVPSVQGTVDTYSVFPSLPLGLNLDGTSGVISGTPSVSTSATNYVITATNASGSTHATVSIATDGFFLVSVNVLRGQVWEINRRMELDFNMDVDFSTVNLNTLSIRTTEGIPAVGTFSSDPGGDESIILFQPNCPTEPDLSDAGLIPGLVPYVLDVPDTSDGGGFVIRSDIGMELMQGATVNFSTATIFDPFLDTVVGPPLPVVRDVDSTDENASYLEIGGDDQNRVYFEFDSNTQTFVTDPPGFQVPLNLIGSAADRVAAILEINQSVNPSPTNLNMSRVRMEFLDNAQVWRPLLTRVTLLENCALDDHSVVRLDPLGIFPPDSQVRVVILPGFQDLVGQTTLLQIDDFGVVPTEAPSFTSLTPPDDAADQVFEEFVLGGDVPTSLEDTEPDFASARAQWENGQLTAGFDFSGEGGPGGDFDWHVRSGEVFIFDTTATQIIGGPNGIPTTIQDTVNGIVDVRDLLIEENATLRVIGPNTMKLTASRDVIIRGTLDLSGFNAPDVATLNTGHIKEQGASGAAGGGRGGCASSVLNGSTPQGDPGFGAFDFPGAGGVGGESAFAPASLGVDARRPGGGGGGRLAADQEHPSGRLIAQDGFNGNPQGRGAITGLPPALGGAAGPGPFQDADPLNDVFGHRPIVDANGNLVGIVEGELDDLTPGAGGGGGGDAVPSDVFPQPNWNPASDEKGGPGGGAGGGLSVKALGRIVFGNSGTLLCNGGNGARGENTLFLDHVGGSGGGASGGHVVLESATEVDFTDGDPVNAPVRNYVSAVGGTGGDGWEADNWSKGGDGGPGIIQIHVPDPISPPGIDPNTTDIIVPLGAAQMDDPLEFVAVPAAIPMIPNFAAVSKARSKWIGIGGADQDPNGGKDLVTFGFDGTDTAAGPDQGKVLVTDEVIEDLPALLTGQVNGVSGVSVQPDEVTLRLPGQSLNPLIQNSGVPGNDIYLRAPALLRGFRVQLSIYGSFTEKDFDIVDATYDDANGVLLVTVDGSDGTLTDFVSQVPPNRLVRYRLLPRFFSVLTAGVDGTLREESSVRILFQAVGADSSGMPDEANVLVDWTGDIGEFNGLAAGELKFFRFEIEFDLDVLGTGLSIETDPVSLDFLKIPLRF